MLQCITISSLITSFFNLHNLCLCYTVAPYRLIIQDDGNLVLYDANDDAVGLILQVCFCMLHCFVPCSTEFQSNFMLLTRLRKVSSRVKKHSLPTNCLLTCTSKYEHMQHWNSDTNELPSGIVEEEVVLSAGACV